MKNGILVYKSFRRRIVHFESHSFYKSIKTHRGFFYKREERGLRYRGLERKRRVWREERRLCFLLSSDALLPLGWSPFIEFGSLLCLTVKFALLGEVVYP